MKRLNLERVSELLFLAFTGSMTLAMLAIAYRVVFG